MLTAQTFRVFDVNAELISSINERENCFGKPPLKLKKQEFPI
jgi:hypothetical protein